jgi:hypothetical protein
MTTTESGAAVGASEGGRMNENPWASAPAHKKANTPNTPAILFANPEVANCKTVDLTNIRLRHCGKQTGFFMLQLGAPDAPDVKILRNILNPVYFH